MALPDRLVSDELLRKAVIAGFVVVLGACIVSQVMLQLGGGPRDEPMDLSSQFPAGSNDSLGSAAVFPDGLPPFISCGGVFYPEKAVFDVGLAIGGLLFCFLGVAMFLRTGSSLRESGGSNWRRGANVGQLASACVIGVSMVMITRHPFDVSLMMHLFYAMNIFYGSFIWGTFLTLSRSRLDGELTCRGNWKLSTIRWSMVAAGFISFVLMSVMVANGNLTLAAFFEWTLTFAAEGQALTILPILALADSEEEAPAVASAD